MDITNLIIFLAIGALAGWLAGLITKGGGYGLLGDIVIGVLGAVVGGYVFGVVGVAASGIIGSIVTATVGAVILIFLVRVLKRA
ncbi:MAG: GlsB/YeaQ/YmgE family stress response membrane protein [Pseudomonadota bacterium]|uniref:GlsB/YeaQ/YmgE family stress response membrane protein n=1 Tax=Thalassolituus maritimus TaxID=484498 RepID=A0ABP9ZYA2_9GAMM|nr:GlsB/YeaQ/YmgE family stress response membrane protein [Pseudomonadota bacterium]MEC8103447.1 GlsB/YeaQ/YmgE family stress response membrane protein [Pseudomonadota bacterium]MEC8525344.1 GlsB/YeaQ/YmgE family stress response membrane protein [Pseudomonadota bacterium]MEE2749158.1 GlsB/YeaQ/YmgE family stress response membrane protein [Pseudomonadota bacterium]|tara:strand:+ start:756 stop:1007 length:252 start_codon:yes stop_codon:yes gene_type:complete